jgi:histidinol-phosphatase (PHP family)
VPRCRVPLPADRHVHSEWSWDAANGSMEQTCARAVAMGLPAVAFTEHVDHDGWPVSPEILEGHEHLLPYYQGGILTPGLLDLQGYLDCLQTCREKFPTLRIISGVELGEPHRHAEQAADLVAAGQFELILGSLHGLLQNGKFAEVGQMLRERKPDAVIREYLLEAERLVADCQTFSVLAHIDYPARYRDDLLHDGTFEPDRFEDEFRHVLVALAKSDRALEVNTRIEPFPQVIRWWREAGGQAITFGSDAHVPTALAAGFAHAAALAESEGFRPGRDPEDVWHRVRP